MSLLVDRLCQKFWEEWSTRRPDLSTYLSSLSAQDRSQAAARLIEIDVSLRQRAGEEPSPDDYKECLSEDELSRLSNVFEIEQFTKSTGARGAEQTWREGAPDAPPVKRHEIGRYRVLGILGEGAFGTVYRAEDESLSREVAVKVPRIGGEDPAALVASLLQEAQAAAKVSHPNIVTVHDCGKLDQNDCFVVFEFVPGGHLGHELLDGPMTVQRSVELMIQIAEGVHHAHTNGLFHRDLKPANILIHPDGKPRIADFGLAVLEERQLEVRGEVTGTPSYMSPEQIRGESHYLDGRSDIWSLGVILYEMLTGTRPFKGEDVEDVFERVQKDTVRPLRQIDDRIPKELEAICRKCLRSNPEQRYSTAGDLAADLRASLSKESRMEATASFKAVADSVITPEVWQPAPKSTPRKQSVRSKFALRFCAAAGMLAGLIVLGSELLDRENHPPDHSERRATGSLLKSRPVIFAWNRDDDTLPPLFDSEAQAFSIRQSRHPLYALIGEHPVGPFRLNTAISLDQDWCGFAGVLIGICDTKHPVSGQIRTCFSVEIFRTRKADPIAVRVEELTFENRDSVEWKPAGSRTLQEVELKDPVEHVAALELIVDGESLQVGIDGQSFDKQQYWRPKLPDWHKSWTPSKSRALGITGKGNQVVISQLVVE